MVVAVDKIRLTEETTVGAGAGAATGIGAGAGIGLRSAGTAVIVGPSEVGAEAGLAIMLVGEFCWYKDSSYGLHATSATRIATIA
ncbi:hypothetical protein PTRG_05517 [Pyrenophora tritici-repentis Pt-1C-BFP]|uniref:Uncharacterized protein n=1 Tax=Pyrenophora tritici-repentis (strain Pt-1C-BFP) TaxID=426418 RepID=B2W6S9_PYRTR|nr:uncharacterized protein PTRG_05517 [Pyrenophora tritici-repentis Pt-1C-BFP]EDU48437.1 hypothetical protein PTRG_05517 [Pyrenophora tritici-repentis Pt-1C-BFP]